MRLPIDLEREVQQLEAMLDRDARGGQHAGPTRLRALRAAIEIALKAAGEGPPPTREPPR